MIITFSQYTSLMLSISFSSTSLSVHLLDQYLIASNIFINRVRLIAIQDYLFFLINVKKL